MLAAATSREGCNLGSLALYGPLLQELGLAAIMDQYLCRDPRQEYSHGQVLAVLLQARLCEPLALMNVSHWAEESGAALLSGIPTAKLNDDRLGRALDAFFEQRHSVLAQVTAAALKWADVSLDHLHFDPTHLTFTGGYENSEPRPVYSRGQSMPSNGRLPAAHIGHGYLSKRRMLQVGVAAFVDEINFVPIFVHPLDGNRNGHTAMQQQYDLMRQYLKLSDGLMMISDRGTFSAEHVARLYRHGNTVLCALPWNDYVKLYDSHAATLQWQRASFLSQEQTRRRQCASPLPREQYDLAVIDHAVPDELPAAADMPADRKIPARVIFVKSSSAAQLEAQRREKNIDKIQKGLTTLAAKLLRGHPCNTPDSAHRNILRLMGKKSAAQVFCYDIVLLTPQEQAALPAPQSGHRRATHQLLWSLHQAAAEQAKQYDGLYALLTTAPADRFSADALFTRYKQQAYIERSHHEWKTPLAVTPVFLQSPQRVEALVCLLFMALQFRQIIERRYRLASQNDKLLSQRRMTAEKLEKSFRTCLAWHGNVAGRHTLLPTTASKTQRLILQTLRFPSLARQLLPKERSG